MVSQLSTRVLITVLALLLMTQSSVEATPPLVERGHQDETIRLGPASATCGFDIFGHFEGDFHFRVFYDNQGNIVREVDTFPSLKVTIFAPSTGKSYTSASPAVLHTEYTNGAALGSAAIATVTGLLEKIPGIDMEGGRISFNAVVVDYTEAGVPLIQFTSVISSAGPHLDALFRIQRCAAMMP